MAHYLIELKPISSFFFGTEDPKSDDEKVNYFQRSAYFPQQTALLGMMRFQLLKQYGLLSIKNKIKDTDMASRLIGEKSFHVSSELPSFGVINSLSPLMLLKDDNKEEAYYLFDKSYVRYSDDEKRVKLKLEMNNQASLRSENHNIPAMPLLVLDRNGEPSVKYIAKYPFVSEFDTVQRNKAKEGKTEMHSLFHSKEQVGIEKSPDGVTKEDAYYKMEYKTLEKEWKFGFVVDLNDDLIKKLIEDSKKGSNQLSKDDLKRDLKGDFVVLGKERSTFKMSVTKIDKNKRDALLGQSEIEYPQDNNNDMYKISLLSDTYIDDEKKFYKHTSFANIDTIDFNNIFFKVSPKDNRYDSKPKKGGRRKLIKRGSEIFTKEPETLIRMIKEDEIARCFYKIGYNHFIINKL
jgi:CRISPR type III-B/RAMP module-associated protein Cmr3